MFIDSIGFFGEQNALVSLNFFFIKIVLNVLEIFKKKKKSKKTKQKTVFFHTRLQYLNIPRMVK